MAKITRKTQKTFGSSAGATGITEYGSPASGTPVYDTDPDNIQTTAWETGWSAAALAGTEIPTFQDFNAIHFVATRQIGYLLQEGIAEYDAGTEYHQNSIVKKSGTYELYGSLINTNTGNALPSQTDDANWKYLGDLAELVNAGAAPVDSVFGRTGAVAAQSSDYDASQIDNDSSVSGATVADALNTLASDPTALAVGSYALMQNASGGNVASNSTTAGSNLRVFYFISGAANIGATPSGTWKNMSGETLGNTEAGIWYRTA